MTLDRKTQIQMLNILLKLPGLDVFPLDERGWNALLDKLYFAVYGETGREFKQDTFHFAMTRAGIARAQGVLRDLLPQLVRPMKGTDPSIKLELEKQWLLIATDQDGRYHRRYAAADGPTLITLSIMERVLDLRLTCRDFLRCSNPTCGAMFIPRRKPHAGRPPFCGKLCAGKIAAQNFRRKHKKKLRKVEQKRSRKRYEDKVSQIPGAKIRRRVREK